MSARRFQQFREQDFNQDAKRGVCLRSKILKGIGERDLVLTGDVLVERDCSGLEVFRVRSGAGGREGEQSEEELFGEHCVSLLVVR